MSNSYLSDQDDLNLSTHRQTASVWERRGWDGNRDKLAIPRLLVGIGGCALAIQALRHRSFTLAGVGGSLAWWALAGEGDLSDARRWVDRVSDRALAPRRCRPPGVGRIVPRKRCTGLDANRGLGG